MAIVDDFNRANEGPPPSSSWSNSWKGSGLVVASNRMQSNQSDGTPVGAYWNGATYTDVDISITIPTINENSWFNEIELQARLVNPTSSSTVDGYAARLWYDGGGSGIARRWSLYRIDDGVYTSLAVQDGSPTAADGYKIRFTVQGSTLKMFYDSGGGWTERLSTTDSTYSAAGYVGVFTDAASSQATFDDFDITQFASIEQEGFRWGVDDGSESAHGWEAAQDTNITVDDNTNRLLRVLLNATADPASTAFSVRSQKNGTGGYTAVPVGASTTTSPPAAPSATVTTVGTASGTWNLNRPNASNGDLIVYVVAWDDSTDTTSVTPPAGPNSETAQSIAGPQASASTEMRIQAWYYAASGTWSGGTGAWTPSASETCRAVAFVIPAGQFNAADPIGWANTRASAGTAESNVNSPTGTTESNDGNGRIYIGFGSDADAITAPGSNWNTINNATGGGVGLCVGSRDTLASNSESVSALTATITSDSWASLAFVVKPNVVSHAVYIATSANITAGGEATTARLTAPSGKTTSDFVTGRRWDDENGTDTIDITTDDYTEVEWNIFIADGQIAGDYWDFRVYGGGSALSTYTATPRWTIPGAGPTEKTSGENIALGITDTSSIALNQNVSDSLALQVSEGAGQVITAITGADALRALLLESNMGDVDYATTDPLAVVAAEDRSLAATLTREDSLLLGVADTAAVAVTIGASDSLALGIADATLNIATVISSTDTVVVGLSEDRSMAVVLTASEAVALGLIEDHTLAVTLAREDALRLGLLEDAALHALLQRDDAALLGLTEDRSLLAVVAREDAPAIILVDASSLSIQDLGDEGLITKSSSDALSVGLLDAYLTLFAQSAREETLAIAWQESATLLARLTRDDAQMIGLVDNGVVAVSISATTDSLAITISESSTQAVAVSGADALRTGLTDDSRVAVRVSGDDAVAAILQESATLLAILRRDDTLAANLTDAYAHLMATVQRADAVALVLVDAATVRVPLASADAVVIGTTESGNAIEVFLNRLGNVLVATVKRLSGVRTIARLSVRTVIYLGGPRTLEVL